MPATPDPTEVDLLLAALRRQLPDLIGSVVASSDGLLVTHDLPARIEPTGMAALISTQLALSQRLVDTALGTDLEELVVCGPAGHVAVYAAGPKAILGVLGTGSATVGRTHLESRPIAQRIAEVLGRATGDR
ncbi:roadblock/LC7 domain-containing protein [Nocardia sp. NPDC057668]|uniref:roadblock/LC7 domain-containing protein n=1 Tax=Nocardia sp. NPDC057668 TaxID=3346202 RepID=UPI003670F01C